MSTNHQKRKEKRLAEISKWQKENPDKVGGGRKRQDSNRESRSSRFSRGSNRESRSSRFSRGSRDYNSKQTVSADCEDCGKKCELPFKPRGIKPVYCRECFRNHETKKHDRSNRRYNTRDNDGVEKTDKFRRKRLGERNDEPWREGNYKKNHSKIKFARNPSQFRKKQKEFNEKINGKNSPKIITYKEKFQNEREEFIKEKSQSPEFREWKKKFTQKVELEVLTEYSKRVSNSDIPCCACCGENSHIEFLTVNHIKGRDEMSAEEKALSGIKVYHWLSLHQFPDGYQVLCRNCDSAKTMLGKCPHQK